MGFWNVALWLFAGTAAPSAPADALLLFERLPATVEGFHRDPAAERFDRDTLFEHIDGHAELFLSYGFEGARVFRYRKEGEEPIELEIYDMGRSGGAFGVFAHGMERAAREVGQGSQYLAGMLCFWKDRFFVSITAFPESETKKRAVYALARAAAHLIPREGPLPETVRRLPAEGLVPESVRCFHHPVWLAGILPRSEGNPLAIGKDSPAALGRYVSAGRRHLLVLIDYRDERSARQAEIDARRELLGGAAEPVQRPDGRFAGMRRSKKSIALVLDAENEDTVRQVLDRTAKQGAK
jgi:hypothetical protein